MKNTLDLKTLTMINDIADNAIAHFVFAHGAGADMHHEFMQTMTQLLRQQQISVTRFNFPYMQRRQRENKRFPPDRMPKLLECYQYVLAELITDLPLFIGGKSMGSRVAATLLASDTELIVPVQGLICLGYPFHPVNKGEKLRLQPLQQTLKPTLIIQGERDTLGNKREINTYDLPDNCQVNFLIDGDHSFKPRVKSGYRYEQHLQQASQLISRFIHGYVT